MIHTVIFDNEIKLWWDYVYIKPNQNFKITIDGNVFYTKNSHYNFKDLKPKTIYQLSVCVVDDTGNVILSLGEIFATTKKKKNRIDITKSPYNAVGDGKTLNTTAIQRALNACTENDCVYIPKGTFLTGALNIESNTELYLSDCAVLQGSTDCEDYLPKIKCRFEGWEMLCYRSLINTGVMNSKNGCDTENIIIRGGTILGGGSELRKNIIEKERKAILKANNLENAESPDDLYLTTLPGRLRGRTLCCCNTKNVIVANTTIGNSPSWNLHFIYCEDVLTCGCKIVSHKIANGDGWDPDSSKNCTIFDVEFSTGDDCVAIKSGKNPEGYFIARPSENINVFDCYCKEGHGVAIGSEMSGGISNVNVWNVKVESDVGINIKTLEKRGGYIKNVNIYDCDVPMIKFDRYNNLDDGEFAPLPSVVSNVTIKNVTLKGVWAYTENTERKEPESALSIRGFSKENPIKNVTIENVKIKYRVMLPFQTVDLENVENVSIEKIVCYGEVEK